MKNSCLRLIIAIAILNGGCDAFAQSTVDGTYFKDYPSPNSGTATPSAPATSEISTTPSFRTSANIRPAEAVGLSVGIYGGAIAFQDGTLHITSSSVPGAEIKGDTQSELGGVAGLRFENTWASFSAIGGDPTQAKPSIFMPAMGVDLFWTGYQYKATDATFGSGSSLKADMNTFTAMYTSKVKINLGTWRPYVGAGVGATYVNAGNAQFNVPGAGVLTLTGSDDDIAFSAQAMAGCEVFVDPRWSVSFDYKYLFILSPTFHGNIDGAPIQYKINGLNNSLFTAGLNFYF